MEVFQVSNGTAYFTSFEMLSISWNSNRSAVEPSGNRMVYSLNVVRKGSGLKRITTPVWLGYKWANCASITTFSSTLYRCMKRH